MKVNRVLRSVLGGFFLLGVLLPQVGYAADLRKNEDQPMPLAEGQAYASPEEEALHTAWDAFLEKDYETAYDLLSPFATQENDPGFDALYGRLLFLWPEDESKAPEGVIRLKQAAEAGYLYASYRYGRLLAEGIHLPKDPETALTYIQPAADCGMPNATAYMGYMYFGSAGIPQDLKKGTQYARHAAYADNPMGQFFYGAFIEQNARAMTEALRKKQTHKTVTWIMRAAENGLEDAKSIVENTYRPFFIETGLHLMFATMTDELRELITKFAGQSCGFTAPIQTALD